MSDAEPILTIEDLAVSFPVPPGQRRTQAVDRVNLSIYPKQTLAVVGESGSGKSVSAMSILRLIPCPPGRIDSGRILWKPDPRSPADDSGHLQRHRQ